MTADGRDTPDDGPPSTGAGKGAGRVAAPAPGLHVEVLLVLGVSLGASAIWSILRIVERLTREVPLAQQTSALNTSVTPDRPWLDLVWQLTGISLALVPVGLAAYLLRRVQSPIPAGTGAAAFLGGDLRRPGGDVRSGVLLAALIGVPGLGFYLVARAAGLNTQVAAATLTEAWWTVPVLVLAAVENAVLEEVVVVGYLLTRLGQAGWRPAAAIAASSIVRGSYHLYQGFGGFLGNVVMGVVFALWYRRTGRVGPLVVAHALIDIVAFVGYAALHDRVGWL